MINAYTWFIGLLFFAFEGTLLSILGADGWALQTGIVLTLLVAFEREFVPGALILAFWLLPIEWMVAGPMGHYSLGLVLIFFLARLVGPSIQGGGVPRFVAALVATLLHGAIVAASFLVFEPSSRIGRAALWELLPAGLITAAATVGIGLIFQLGDDRLFPERKKRGLLNPT